MSWASQLGKRGEEPGVPPLEKISGNGAKGVPSSTQRAELTEMPVKRIAGGAPSTIMSVPASDALFEKARVSFKLVLKVGGPDDA